MFDLALSKFLLLPAVVNNKTLTGFQEIKIWLINHKVSQDNDKVKVLSTTSLS